MITLVLGGTRSGKSAVAEAIAARSGAPVTYIATAVVDANDTDHVARIDRHRARRPDSWITVECFDPADLAPTLSSTSGVVLLDSIGTWVAGHESMADITTDKLLDALDNRDGDTIVVSEEVGLALHAPTEIGRRFVDAVGDVNHALSGRADRALLVVAGRTIELPDAGALPC